MSGEMNTHDKIATMHKTVINHVEAPSLKSVFTRPFIKIKRLTVLYQKQVEEKARNLKEIVFLTSLRASMEDGDSSILIAARWIDAPRVDEITARQIALCFAKHCKREAIG